MLAVPLLWCEVQYGAQLALPRLLSSDSTVAWSNDDLQVRKEKRKKKERERGGKRERERERG